MANPIPVLPPQYKSLNHCLKIASEHDVRDPVVAYWCRFYSVQQGLVIDRNSPDAKKFLLALMDWLEFRKKEMRDNEAITNEAVAEAHIENYALRIFNWADSQDRSGIFNKNVIKTFYTAGILIDVLTNFNKGNLSEDLVATRKYAKWKAAYINNCLKNGETPKPGPIDDIDEDSRLEIPVPPQPSPSNSPFPTNPPLPGFNMPMPPTQTGFPSPSYPPSNYSPAPSTPRNFDSGYSPAPPSKSTEPSPPASAFTQQDTSGTGSNSLSVSEITKAQKYIKWAGSALNFDDVSTAVTNLEKALNLLKTGRDD